MRVNQIYFFHSILKNMVYYAVAKGRNTGIYSTWDECQKQVTRFSGPIFKKFTTKAAAEEFILKNSESNQTPNKNSASVLTKRLRAQKTKLLEGTSQESSSTKSEAPKRKTMALPTCESPMKRTRGEYIIDSNGYVNVYTDGACSSNGRKNAKAGIGVWFGDDHPLNVSRPVVGRATNNMAEIQAVTVAAQQAAKAGIKNLKINTDSQFLISCITSWMPKWKRNGWKTSNNEPVINKTELLEMEKALNSLDVTWNHVNGHVGIYGNEMADQLARAGCEDY
ncbi:ribonuclease H1 isoform X1 [Megachile rotundata]|uniref:ribonuclease H1 isoform X1 n=2 Tax=Megachile rotundata TaxID=143995 RepID=UPI003FCFB5B9